MFVNLFNHSHYSILMSSISIDDIINFAIKNNQKQVFLTDYNTLYGAMEFYTKAKAKGLEPVIGLHVKYNDEDVYLIAKNNKGYSQLVKISSLIMTGGGFDINQDTTNLFIVLKNIDVSWLNNKENAYSYDQSNAKPIAASHVFFESKDDILFLKSLWSIKNDKLLSEYDNDNTHDEFYFKDFNEAKQLYSNKALDNLNTLMSLVTWTVEFNHKNHLITFDKNKSSRLLLQSLCVEGLKEMFHNKTEISLQYATRLKFELDIIDRMNFNDYFLIVQDYVGYAKHNGIVVGPGRGSAAGSLVAYTLGITQLDPIKNNLIFERFLNPERISMPDIDVDFMDSRRDEVVLYLLSKYSKQHIAHIVTFQRMKPKMATRDAGRILNINQSEINSICKSLNDFSFDSEQNSATTENYIKQYPLLFKIAKKLNGFPRQTGLHAAGIVLCQKNLEEIIPIQSGTGELFATQFSMEWLEPLGLIKFDILGLSNLTTIDNAIKLIKKNKSIDFKVDKIPLDDQRVFDFVKEGNTTGVFQLESPGMTNLLRKIKPKNIEDISICSALYRPGPQKNIETYLANKENPQNISYMNNDFKEVLSSTYNIIIYQEQVIQMVCKIANYSLAQADLFRKAISKKNIDNLNKLKKDFCISAIQNNYSKEEVETIYNYIIAFANYGFNHSHSLAYSYISYWLAYISFYYPLEFFASILNNNSSGTEDVAIYITKIKNRGIKINEPSINKSINRFLVNDKEIICSFNSIKGIGDSLTKNLLEIRDKHGSFSNLTQCVKTLKNNNITFNAMHILAEAGAFNELVKDKKFPHFYVIKNIEELYNNIDDITPDGEWIKAKKLYTQDPTEEETSDLIAKQTMLLGISFADHPLTNIKKEYRKNNSLEIDDLTNVNKQSNKEVFRTLCFIKKKRVVTDKFKREMAFLTIEDDTKSFSAVLFSTIFEKVSQIIEANKPLILTVKLDFKNDNNLIVLNIKGIL